MVIQHFEVIDQDSQAFVHYYLVMYKNQIS